MAACPACGRPFAVAGPRCLYCGAALPPGAPAEAAATTKEPTADPERCLVVVECAGKASLLAAALGVSRFVAEQQVRRGGWHLHRVTEPGEARLEADRLAAAGVAVRVLPGGDVATAAQPRVALGGRRELGRLRLRTSGGDVDVGEGELLLVVRGPVAREYLAEPSTRRRPRGVGLDDGYRIHLHARSDLRPIELDPGSFDFGSSEIGSSLVRLSEWVAAARRDAPEDDRFRYLAPALAPAAATPGLVSAAGALRAPRPAARGGSERVVLDNVAQFRFYSAWRGVLVRAGDAPAPGSRARPKRG